MDIKSINPIDFLVEVIPKNMGTFAQIDTKTVRVLHLPTGISSTRSDHRSQHANRNAAFDDVIYLLNSVT